MDELLRKYENIKEAIGNSIFDDWIMSSVSYENMTEREREEAYEKNRKERIFLSFEQLRIVVELIKYDMNMYKSEMKKSLDDVISKIQYTKYYYDSEEDQEKYIVSVLRFLLGKCDFIIVKDYLPEEFCDKAFLCDGHLLRRFVNTVNYFDEKEDFKTSEQLVKNFIELNDDCNRETNQDMFYGILGILLCDYLAESKPLIAADLYIGCYDRLNEYLELSESDKLFVIANNLIPEDAEKAKAIFQGILHHRKLFFDITSIYVWAIEIKIVSCDVLIYKNTDCTDAMEELINRGINGEVTDVDKNNKDVFKIDIAMYCSLLLRSAVEIISVSRYGYILQYFFDFCKKNDDISEWICKKKSYEYMGAYHMEKGEYLQAEQFYLKTRSLAVAENDTEGKLVYDIRLIAIYYLINDEKRFLLCDKVYNELDKNFYDMVKSEERVLKCSKIFIGLYVDCNMFELENSKHMINALNFIEKYSLISKDIAAVEDAYLVTAWININLQLNKISKNNAESFISYLKSVEQFDATRKDVNLMRVVTNLYGILYGMSDEDSCLEYLLYSYENYRMKNSCIDFQYVASTADAIANIYIQKNEIKKAVRYLDESLSIQQESLSMALRYLDEDKLVNMIEKTVDAYEKLYYYSVDLDNDVLYNYILKFKDLKSYIVQVRNELLHHYPDERGILVQIRHLNDQIAKINTSNTFFSGMVSVDALKNRLEELEAQFEVEFPAIDISPQISSNNLLSKLNNNQAIIEYVRYNRTLDNIDSIIEHYHDGDKLTEIMMKSYEYQMYVIRNINGNLVINRENIGTMDIIGEKVYELLECMIYDSEVEEDFEHRMIVAKVDLYKTVFQPGMRYLEGVNELFIAPTDDISAVPFDVLGRKNKEFLIDNYNIRYIDCGRDLLRTHKNSSNTDALLIGDPAYSYVKQWERDNGSRSRKTSLNPLPFSNIEVSRISKKLKSKLYTNHKATKYLLLNAKNYKYIHIATHGDFDYEYEKNPLYASCLYFAGAQNWLDTKKEDKYYGNGIVTADEISRLNLYGTELVVLSSCYSGALNVDMAKGASGLRSSFKVAGVKYIVMSQWELYDLASAVMMDRFYDYIQAMPVPEALRKAKLYLREVTVHQLEQDGWFKYLNSGNKKVQEQINELIECSPQATPFSDIRYWGSMACMEC